MHHAMGFHCQLANLPTVHYGKMPHYQRSSPVGCYAAWLVVHVADTVPNVTRRHDAICYYLWLEYWTYQ